MKRYYHETYKIRVVIIITTDPDLVLSQTGYDTGGEVFAHTVHSSIGEGGTDWNCVYLIFNPKNPHGKITAGIIAHESFHASNIIFSIIGQKADQENDEAQAHLIEWIANRVEHNLDAE